MRGITWAAAGLEHAVTEYVPAGKSPIRLYLRLWHIRVRQRGRAHLALRKAVHCPAVYSLKPAQVTVVKIAAIGERNRLKRNHLAVADAALRRIRAGKPVEQVIEGSVFLHDDHDVIDRRTCNWKNFLGRQRR